MLHLKLTHGITVLVPEIIAMYLKVWEWKYRLYGENLVYLGKLLANRGGNSMLLGCVEIARNHLELFKERLKKYAL